MTGIDAVIFDFYKSIRLCKGHNPPPPAIVFCFYFLNAKYIFLPSFVMGFNRLISNLW